MSNYFTCPKCAGHFFGRDIGRNESGEIQVLDTVLCHGSSSSQPYYSCDWRGVWPPEPSTVKGGDAPMTVDSQRVIPMPQGRDA